MTSQDEKAELIGGGESPSYEDNSIRSWKCGCYEDQSGYHLCFLHLQKEPNRITKNGWIINDKSL